jgi:hypothetical protein
MSSRIALVSRMRENAQLAMTSAPIMPAAGSDPLAERLASYLRRPMEKPARVAKIYSKA